MARPKKNDTVKAEESVADIQPVDETNPVEEVPEKDEPTDKVSPRDEELMRLYPQYEEIWITPEGFVHPVGAPRYLLKGAKLFKNKYYNK